MYVATINVPGYLPTDDDPPGFETAREAWQYLAEQLDLEWRSGPESPSQATTLADLDRRANPRWLVCDFERVGTVYGPTPGYDGDHDLGLAYSVEYVEDTEEEED